MMSIARCDLTKLDAHKDEYMRRRPSYKGFLGSVCDCNFDIELAGKIIQNLKLGKAADIDSQTSEHLLNSHPILP